MASLWEVEQYSGNFFGAFGMLENQGFKRSNDMGVGLLVPFLAPP